MDQTGEGINPENCGMSASVNACAEENTVDTYRMNIDVDSELDVIPVQDTNPVRDVEYIKFQTLVEEIPVKGKKERCASKEISNPNRSLWISNISANTNAKDVQNLLSKYGKVSVAKIVQNVHFKRLCAYATMETIDAVNLCIEKLNKSVLKGKTISVTKSKCRLSSSSKAITDLSEKCNKTLKTKTTLPKNKSKELCETLNKSEAIVTFDKIKERQREIKRSREKAAEERKLRREKELFRERQKRQRDEVVRLEREKEKLRIERENIDKLRAEFVKQQRERQNEMDKLKKGQEELKRQQLQLEKARRTFKETVEASKSEYRNNQKRKDDRHERISLPSRLKRESSSRGQEYSQQNSVEVYHHHTSGTSKYDSYDVNRKNKRDVHETIHTEPKMSDYPPKLKDNQHINGRLVPNTLKDKRKLSLAEIYYSQQPYNPPAEKIPTVTKQNYRSFDIPSEKPLSAISSSTISSRRSSLSEDASRPYRKQETNQSYFYAYDISSTINPHTYEEKRETTSDKFTKNNARTYRVSSPERLNYQKNNSSFYRTQPEKLISYQTTPYNISVVKPFTVVGNSSKQTMPRATTWEQNPNHTNVSRNIPNSFDNLNYSQQNNYSVRRYEYNDGRKY